MNLLDDLSARGLLHQCTDEAALRAALAEGTVTGYIGFDPTASSLHVGSLLQILNLVRLQRAGHRAIAVAGGGTGLIGDPSGKGSERQLLTPDVLAGYLEGIRGQLARYLDFDAKANPAVLVDNAEWLCKAGLLDFLRDVGKHFSVNAMVQRDSVKKRLEEREQGISYTEFSYMLLQAWDFLALYDRYGCRLQMGGSDQWGNIVSGADLIRRKRDVEAWGLTAPLVTDSAGNKFGKTEKGAVWLDPARTTPYEFYQFWLNTADADVDRYLRYFTFLPVDEIAAVAAEHAAAPQARGGQRRLADEVTRYVHGDEALRLAHLATKLLFGAQRWRDTDPADVEAALGVVPATPLALDALGTPAASVLELLVSTKLYESKTQARTAISQGGVSVGDAPVREPQRALTRDDLLPGGYVVLRKGKKNYHLLRVR